MKADLEIKVWDRYSGTMLYLFRVQFGVGRYSVKSMLVYCKGHINRVYLENAFRVHSK